MYKQLKERLMNKKDVNSEKIAEKVISDAFSSYFNMFDNGIYERAGFGMGAGRLAQFLLGSTKIIEI